MNIEHLSIFDRRVIVRQRWYRAALFWGDPPGSHIGVWRTRVGDHQGINVRIGRRYIGPCLTFLAHTHPERER